jgi:hypothetical protein
VLWEPGAPNQTENTHESKKKRAFELAAGNEELISLLKELLSD